MLGAAVVAAAAGTVFATAGCRLRVGQPSTAGRSPTPPASSEPSVDLQILDRAADRAQSIGAAYARALALRPDIAAPLRLLAADHAAHLQALTALGARPGRASSAERSAGSTTAASGTTTSPTTPARTSTPAPSPTLAPEAMSVLDAVSILGQAERAAVAGRLADLAGAGAEVARLLASMAACGSTHLTLLARLPATVPKKAS